ncbi:MAG TPA: glycosyltransferase family 2 protein [Glaciibacter sp.]|nr:glycosyltransferase family 2 protein [Glaciibacter sp.]
MQQPLTRERPTGTVVAIVTFNSGDCVAALIESVASEGARPPPRVYVIDNGSTDDTLARAREYPDVNVVETGANLGYSGGINVARRFLERGEALAVLNPDLVLAPDALEKLQRAFDDPAVGIAVPLLRDPDGRVYPHLRREPTISGSLGDALFGARWPNRPRWMSDTLRHPRDYESAHDVAWAGGAALVIAPEVSERIGDWDHETYFLYSEETDYARRTRDAGFRIRFVPEAQATHIGGASGQSAPLLALMAVNRVRYFERHHGCLPSSVFRVVVALHHLLRSGDPRHRFAVRAVCSRAIWATLPPGRPRSNVTARA